MSGSIGSDHRAHPNRGYVHDRTVVFDGADSGDGKLLGGLVGIPKRGVIGLDEQNVCAMVDGVPDQAVVCHLEADDGPGRNLRPVPGRHPEYADGLARGEVRVDQIDLVAEDPEEPAIGDVPAEGAGWRLDISAGRAAAG